MLIVSYTPDKSLDANMVRGYLSSAFEWLLLAKALY